MRSDARKRLAEATTDALRASLSPHYHEGVAAGRQQAIDELRDLLRGRTNGFGGWPAMVSVSDLYTLIGELTHRLVVGPDDAA